MAHYLPINPVVTLCMSFLFVDKFKAYVLLYIILSPSISEGFLDGSRDFLEGSCHNVLFIPEGFFGGIMPS